MKRLQKSGLSLSNIVEIPFLLPSEVRDDGGVLAHKGDGAKSSIWVGAWCRRKHAAGGDTTTKQFA